MNVNVKIERICYQDHNATASQPSPKRTFYAITSDHINVIVK